MPDPQAQWSTGQHDRIDELIDEYRSTLHDCVDDLSEDEVRRRLVPSKTTLLGLIKHVTFMEGVWFDQEVTGRSRADIGIPDTVDESFDVHDDDSVASVQAAYRARCATSRKNVNHLGDGDLVYGRAERPVWALRLQVLRELAHHAGHADILREQILASRTP